MVCGLAKSSNCFGTKRMGRIVNEGPIWIESLTGVSYSSFRKYHEIENGWVKTNYGSFDLHYHAQRVLFTKLINESKHANAPTVSIWGTYRSRQDHVRRFMVNIPGRGNVGMPVNNLNNLITNGLSGNNTSSNPVSRPWKLTVIPAEYNGQLLRAPNPSSFVKIEDSNSYEYIYNNFGEDGRKIEPIAGT